MAAQGPVQFRGIGGVYKLVVQTTTEDDYTLCANWLYATLCAAVGHTRVYNKTAPEQSDIDAGEEFISFAWDHADRDTYTQGPSAVRVTAHYWEVLVWAQGRTYAGITTTATTLRAALDVGRTTTADGLILGTQRDQFRAAVAV